MYTFEDFVKIIAELRSEHGCPWDREQTFQSLKKCLADETEEVFWAIDHEDMENLCEELGDVLLQVVFHADIEKDRGRFDLDDVCDRVCKKLIFRHPHVFGGDTTKSWEDCKALEKGQTTVGEKLDAVARSLPALWRAEKLVNKAKKNGAAVDETLPEAVEGLQTAEDLGKLLFACAQWAAQQEIDPEAALHSACEAFITSVKAAAPDGGANRE